MEHLEEHPHSFIDDNNNVINTSVFNGHDEALLEQIKEHFGASSIFCHCDNNPDLQNGYIYNYKLYPPRPAEGWTFNEVTETWEPPVEGDTGNQTSN